MLQLRRSHRTPLFVWAFGFAVFRFTFPIFTHNSVPLSAFLSLVFVLVPFLVVQRAKLVPTSDELLLPFRRKGKHVPKNGVLKKVKIVFATCLVYCYALRVTQVEFDAEKVDVDGKYFLAVNFWDNEVMLSLPNHFFFPSFSPFFFLFRVTVGSSDSCLH